MGCVPGASPQAIDLRTGEQWGNTPCTSALQRSEQCMTSKLLAMKFVLGTGPMVQHHASAACNMSA